VLKHFLSIAVVGAVLITATASRAQAEAAHPAPAPKLKLTDGARSIDGLLEQFQSALDAKDENALRKLRVTEREYREIIIPGTVKPGQPPREVAPTPSVFFWQMIDQKSDDVARHLIELFGGHKTRRISVKFTKGTREFAWYKSHGDVQLTLQDEQGRERELRTGAIAEVDGRFKFIGFNSN
jgi:hypothetical protein